LTSTGTPDIQTSTGQQDNTLVAQDTSTGTITEKEPCTDIITRSILLGGNNDIEEVKALEQFLNDTQGEKLEVDGRYNQEDYEAVKRFQTKYRADILDPWGVANPTGYVYKTTIKKINELYCQ